jgi:hypothetical protein
VVTVHTVVPRMKKPSMSELQVGATATSSQESDAPIRPRPITGCPRTPKTRARITIEIAEETN